MEIQTVSRKQRARTVEQKEEIAIDHVQTKPEPVARVKFVPSDCSMCTEYRPKDKCYARVYHTAGSIRYCKCDFCGHTWKQKGAIGE